VLVFEEHLLETQLLPVILLFVLVDLVIFGWRFSHPSIKNVKFMNPL
jgi:hypothetical protein